MNTNDYSLTSKYYSLKIIMKFSTDQLILSLVIGSVILCVALYRLLLL